jgi:flagellar basal body-associated protein FliL
MKKRGSALVWILAIAIIIVIIVTGVLLFVFKSQDSSSNTVADNKEDSLSAVNGFTKVNVGDVEFLNAN